MYHYTLLTIFLTFVLTILYLVNPSSKSKKYKLPPGPKPWPIIGNIHQLGSQPHRSVAELSKIYGPLMTLKLGSITTVVISSPEVAKEMFNKHDLALSSRNIPNAVTVQNHENYSMVWLPVCPKWRNLRKIAAIQLFTKQPLDASQGLRMKKVEELIAHARHCCEKGEHLDIGKDGFITTLNQLSNTFFSFDLTSHDSSRSQEFKNLVCHMFEEGGKPNASDFFPLLRHLDLQGVLRRISGSFNKMFGIFEEIIDQRLKGSTTVVTDDVLGTLLKLVKENELSLEDVKHMLLDLFVAGTHTTSGALEWAMTELLRHPEKMKRAQLEIQQVLGKEESVHESQIAKLPYLQAVVKETFRIHPPTPFLLPHKAVEDVQLCGYDVPNGTQIWINVWSIGHDQSVWKNPNTFEPERFLGKDTDIKGHDFELIPFGTGRRICPGLPLAHRMLHLMLANLLHSFDWKLANGMHPQDLDVEEKFGMVLQKVNPLLAIPVLKM